MADATVSGPRVIPTLPAPLWIAPSILLLVAALTRLPYGFYVFLRLVVCAAAVAVAWQILRRSLNHVTGWTAAALALLYNPLITVRLKRSEWEPVNIATAAFFFGLGLFLTWKSRAQDKVKS
jgi:hypothetical protein